MGVMGLTTFVDNHPQLLSDHRLHDTRVIIDGNNLYYFLYYRYFDINVRYGGDYDQYAESVRYYFNALKACNIEAYVVFDGGYDMDDRKLKTTIKRQHTRLKNVTSLARGQKGQVLPLLANEVFRQVLDELHVHHMTCDFEADDQLATLGRAWGCPIMSNDSDFFIYDLPAGFIIFDYLNLQVHQSDPTEESTPYNSAPYKYLSVQLYKLDNFKHYYKALKKEYMPVFATLMGNDFVDGKDFENFFARVKLPNAGGAGSGRRNNNRVQQRQQKMSAVLMWLSEQESVEKTCMYIVNSFPDEQRKNAWGKANLSIKSYTDFSTHLVDYFDDVDSRSRKRSKLRTAGGHAVPYWVVSGLREGEIPLIVINTLTLRRNLLLPQVELVSEPCSFTCSKPIRVAIYSILMTLDKILADKKKTNTDNNNTKNDSTSVSKDTKIQEYHRNGTNLPCEYIETVESLPGGSRIPYLQSIPHLSPEQRAAIFWEVTGLDLRAAFTSLPPGLHLVLAAMCYWVKHATPKVTPCYVYALVANVIHLMLNCEEDKSSTGSMEETKDDGKYNCDKRNMENWEENLHFKSVDFSFEKVDKLGGESNCDKNDDTKSEDQKSDDQISDDQKGAEKSAGEDTSHEVPKCVSQTVPEIADGNSQESTEGGAAHEKVDFYDKPNHPKIGDLRREMLKDCSLEELKTAKESMNRFTIETEHNSTDNRFHTIITHNYAQFQTCLAALSNLNALLIQPLPPAYTAYVFNGTFVYNLCLELQRRSQPRTYVCEQYGATSHVSALYQCIVDTLMAVIPETTFLTTNNNRGKKHKKGGKRSKSKVDVESDTDSSEESQEREPLTAKCSLTNRFDGLSLNGDL